MIAHRPIVLATALLLLSACPSAYQRTYDQEMHQLESQQRATDTQAAAEHAQAQKYAAVIYFAVGSPVIDTDGQRELRWFVEQMRPYPQAMIQVQGFADATGADATNEGLSAARADAVAGYLSTQGIAAARIVKQAFGSQYAAESNATTKGRRNNRRVEVTVR